MVSCPEPTEGLPIVAVDLDGILAENQWPDPAIGKPIKEGIALVIHYANEGNEVLIYTARPKSHEARIWKWLEMVGLHNDVYDVVCGKPSFGLMVDDRCWNPWKPEGECGGFPSGDGQAAVKSVPPSTPPQYRKNGEMGYWQFVPDEGSAPAKDQGPARSKAAPSSPDPGPPEHEQDDGWIKRMLGAVNG